MKRVSVFILYFILISLVWIAGMLITQIYEMDITYKYMIYCFPFYLLVCFGSYSSIKIGFALFTLSKFIIYYSLCSKSFLVLLVDICIYIYIYVTIIYLFVLIEECNQAQDELIVEIEEITNKLKEKGYVYTPHIPEITDLS